VSTLSRIIAAADADPEGYETATTPLYNRLLKAVGKVEIRPIRPILTPHLSDLHIGRGWRQLADVLLIAPPRTGKSAIRNELIVLRSKERPASPNVHFDPQWYNKYID